jgi:tetratricopeptide (TPR) repeat protein
MQTPDYSFLQHLYATPIYTMVQFGKWNEIINTSLPFKEQPYLAGVWNYAQGLAYCRKGEISKAEKCLVDLKESQSKLTVPETAWINNPKNILKIAEKILGAEIYARAGKKEAKQLYEEAVKSEDALRYNEPADWHKPVRQFYGSYLISIKDYKRAEEMYRQDLIMYPQNGWSLLGLHQSLRGQKKNKEAEEAQKQFKKSWSRSDTKITASAF